MNAAPRRKLREIVERHGRVVLENPRRCAGLLRDYCGEYRREISVLTMALEEHAVADMLAAPASLPRKVLLARLAQRLCDNLALSESAARWSIGSWAWALGVITDAELEESEAVSVSKANEIESAKSVFNSPQIAPQTTPAKRNAPANQTAQTKQTTIAPTAQKVSPQASQAAPKSVFVVSANGGGHFTSISEAVQNVPANSRLIIREGLYRESIVIDKNIEIAGDGAVENVVVQSAHQPCVSMQTEQASVRGLTFQGRGKSNGAAFFAVDVSFGAFVLENCSITSDTLSCVGIRGANANPSIKSCWIHDGADSGVYIFDNARASIESCDIYNNANANVAVTTGANPSIKNCRIFDGDNGGIVVWGNGAAGAFENCEIFNHRLANVGVSDGANPTFLSCKIYGGRDTGVYVSGGGYGKFEDCAIRDNRKAEVVITEKSNTSLRRCAIYNSRAAGILINSEARAFVESCNLYDNPDAGVSLQGASAAAVRRCNIHRNGTVAVQIKENSRASVEDCDLRGNRIATWETEHGVVVERKNNRE